MTDEELQKLAENWAFYEGLSGQLATAYLQRLKELREAQRLLVSAESRLSVITSRRQEDLEREHALSARLAEVQATDQEFRERLWLNHGCPLAMLYCDDGEMQCNEMSCRLDFKRLPLSELCLRLIAAGRLHVGKLPPGGEIVPACPRCNSRRLSATHPDEAERWWCPTCSDNVAEPAYWQRVKGPKND